MNKKRTTVSIPLEKKERLTEQAIKLSAETGRQIKWTDLLFYVLDKYSEIAVIEIMEKEKGE